MPKTKMSESVASGVCRELILSRIGWAKPYATTEHDHVGEFNSFNLTSEIVFDEIIYFDTPKPFNGRPDILTL
jgi:hypothetical protein